MDSMKNKFQNLNFGSADPISVKMETIEVAVSAAGMVTDYARAFINEARRKAPLLSEQPEALSVDELIEYSRYLFTQRIKCVELNCPEWRRLKLLWIPSFIQYVLSCIGEVIDRQYGLRFIPVDTTPSTLSFDEALAISNKIAMYQDCLQMVRDAMPRGVEGDPDVMTCAVIEEYLRSTKRVSHPCATYVAAFFNAKLVNELAFKSLYRVQYDDLGWIRSAMISGGEGLV